MKRILAAVALLFGLATGVAQAQTRVGVSLSFGDPYFDGQVVIGQPYYHRYHPYYYYRYRPALARVIVVGHAELFWGDVMTTPPVPHTSRISRASRQTGSIGGSTDSERSSRANAAISSGVSFFCASAVRKSALVAAETSASSNAPTAARTCAASSDWRAES